MVGQGGRKNKPVILSIRIESSTLLIEPNRMAKACNVVANKLWNSTSVHVEEKTSETALLHRTIRQDATAYANPANMASFVLILGFVFPFMVRGINQEASWCR